MGVWKVSGRASPCHRRAEEGLTLTSKRRWSWLSCRPVRKPSLTWSSWRTATHLPVATDLRLPLALGRTIFACCRRVHPGRHVPFYGCWGGTPLDRVRACDLFQVGVDQSWRRPEDGQLLGNLFGLRGWKRTSERQTGRAAKTCKQGKERERADPLVDASVSVLDR